MRRSCLAALLLFAAVAAAEDSPYEFGGHTKLRLVGQTYPDDSLFRDIAGSSSLDTIGEVRLNLAAKTSGWSFHADYQLLGIYSEFLSLGLPNDDRRLFDFTPAARPCPGATGCISTRWTSSIRSIRRRSTPSTRPAMTCCTRSTCATTATMCRPRPC